MDVVEFNRVLDHEALVEEGQTILLLVALVLDELLEVVEDGVLAALDDSDFGGLGGLLECLDQPIIRGDVCLGLFFALEEYDASGGSLGVFGDRR